MKACIVDDSRLARTELRRLLDEYNDVEIIGEATCLEDAKNIVRKSSPDILFLDIDLPDGNGFEMFGDINEDTLVIFTTAYNEYAVKAFEKNALDYLLKPIDPERLGQALVKASLINRTDTKSEIENQFTLNDTVFIQNGDQCHLIKLKNIRYFKTFGNYCYVYFNNEKILLNKSLNYIESRVDPHKFFRANRQYIINISHIVDIHKWGEGSFRVELSCSKAVEISRRKSKYLSDKMSF